MAALGQPSRPGMFHPPPLHVRMNGLLTPLTLVALQREGQLEVLPLPSEMHPLVCLRLEQTCGFSCP